MARLPDSSWNKTETLYPQDLCVQELFERQVAQTPHSIALIDGSSQYTYSEINASANQIAHVLRARGVVRGSIVGCYLTRSSAIVLYTLAILKAGGIYLLLDAHMPDPRLGYVVADASPLMVVSDTPLPKLEVAAPFITTTIADVSAEARIAKETNLPKRNASKDVAYIAYTSGSTGQPKGVQITHQSTINHALAFSKKFALGMKDRVALMAPIAFDMAIEEMVPPLVSGCTLIVSASQFKSMKEFTAEIVKNGYTILNIPAPLWSRWNDYLCAQDESLPPTLRVVIAGSEEIDTRSLARWKNLKGAQNVQWVAAYGTTETTVTSMFYTSGYTDDLSDERTVPIGKPIANTYAYVLDADMQQVSVGAQGELYIGGHGLARGYLNLPEKTSESFIADPFRPEPGARLYRTGDLARYRPDGNLVWLGRTDLQIKYYGLRIEPGEIEAVLDSAPLVKKSVVVLQQTGMSEEDKHIVAFITTMQATELHESELRQLVMHNLPSLMAPEKYIFLPSFPLNANGKTDRKVLQQFPTDQIANKPPELPRHSNA